MRGQGASAARLAQRKTARHRHSAHRPLAGVVAGVARRRPAPPEKGKLVAHTQSALSLTALANY